MKRSASLLALWLLGLGRLVAQEEPDARLSFGGVSSVLPGTPGEVRRLDLVATVTPRVEGIDTWSLSFTSDGATLGGPTTDGLIIETNGGPWSLEQAFFQIHNVAFDPEDPERGGIISAYIGAGYPGVHLGLLPGRTHEVLRFTAEVQFPAVGECNALPLYHEDGFENAAGSEPISNYVGLNGTSGTLALDPITVQLCVGDAAPFARGDANADGQFNISDPVTIVNWLFRGIGSAPLCDDARDGNDDGAVNISDYAYMLNFLFRGGPPPPPPFGECGADPTDDELTCFVQLPCE